MRVLVVDDEIDLRDAICELLESAGHATMRASNGREALERLKKTTEPTDVILLDLTMPVMDGREFRRAQLADAALALIPVVVITADGNAREKAGELAAQAVLRKPFLADELIGIMKKFSSEGDPQA